MNEQVFIWGVVGFLFILYWVRCERVVRFLSFCAQEKPEADFVKVVSSIRYWDLEVHKPSFAAYLRRLIDSDNGDKVETACRSWMKIDNEKKSDLCRETMRGILLTTDPKKLAEFYVNILRANRDNNNPVLAFILGIAKHLPHKKDREEFIAELNEERVVVSMIKPHLQSSEHLLHAICEIEKCREKVLA